MNQILTVDDIKGYTTLEILIKLLELYNVLSQKVDILEDLEDKDKDEYLEKLQAINDMLDHIIPYVRENYPPLDGLMLQHQGHSSFVKRTYGRYQDACVVSIEANYDNAVAGVEGTDSFGLGTYTNRDSVALYVGNSSTPRELVYRDVAYNENGATFTTGVPSTIKVGSILDVGENANDDWYVGIVKEIKGNQVILEDGWYQVRSDGTTPTKGIPDGTMCINLINKVWCINSNLFVDHDCPAGANMELGVMAYHQRINDVGGIDLINMGLPSHYGIKVRGRQYDFNENFRSETDKYHLTCYGDGDIVYSTPNSETAKPFYIQCDGRHSKEMYNFALVDSGTKYYMKNDDVSIIVTAEGIDVELPFAETGKRCQILSKSTSCTITYQYGAIGTKTGSAQQISGSVQGENVLRTLDFVSDGANWYVTNDSNWVY